ncbi:SusD family protein [Filimonas lacunae]|uniref:SusD family protein n=1 Tax=Filimonas lacunae TaxID=477680 RepID=A0A173MJR7_9BACT|nr:RagB/SusD family nutrient uptake outer membrane protein [Filimonas lacunae]BAV07875.1 hypothetical protein FLA_3906 [Filimonas lacunae]SIT05894.1 SusD family protein [Filimonas lacunae]
MKKISFYITMGLLVAATTGCNRYLDKLPDNRTVIATPEQVTQLLTTAYPRANYITFCEAMTDNAEDKKSPTSDLQNMQPYKYQDVQSTFTDSPEFYFHACYTAIAAANQALEYCNGPDSLSYRAQKGEALVCRAYAHFMLTLLFAKNYDPSTASGDPGVPYVTTVEKNVWVNYSRGTVQKDYDMIERDLVAGIPLLQDKIYGDAPKFHFTQVAANAFAARFYLFKRDYAKVVDYTTAILGPVTITANTVNTTVANMLRNWNGTSTTTIPPGYSASTLGYYGLQALYTQASEPSNLLLQETESNWGTKFPAYRFGLGITVYALFSGTLPTPANTSTSSPLSVGYWMYGSDPQVYNQPKFWDNFIPNGLNSSVGTYYNVIPLLSMEEVLLNRAEALTRLGQLVPALNDLQTWTSKNVISYSATTNRLTAANMANAQCNLVPADGSAAVPVTDSLNLMLNTCLYFKRASYLFEGLRWFDIKRLNIPVTHKTNDGFTTVLVPDDKRRLLQLPQEVQQAGLALNPR